MAISRFGFSNLRPVETQVADLSRTVDIGKMQTTPAEVVLENVDFLPRLGERRKAAPEPYRPSFLEMFDAVAGGDTITEARKRLEKDAADREIAATSRAQLRQLMDTVLKNPRERLAFLANQPEWAKAVSSNFGASNVPGGATRFMPGFGAVTAPEIIESGDSIISATPEGMEVLGRREPSFEEQAKAENNARLAEIREMLANSTMNRQAALTAQGNARLAQGAERIGLARQRAGRGGGGSAAQRRVLGKTLPEGY